MSDKNEMKKLYKAAGKLMPRSLEHSVLNADPQIYWTDTEHFIYRREVREEYGICGKYVMVRATDGMHESFFDSAKLREKLSDSFLMLSDCAFEQGLFSFTHKKKAYVYDVAHDELKELDQLGHEENVSPDGRWEVCYHGYDLILRELETGIEFSVTSDGVEDYAYGREAEQINVVRERLAGISETPGVLWSPDSEKFLTYRLDMRGVRKLHIIRSFDQEGCDSIRPELISYHCSFPEDERVPLAYFYIYDISRRKLIRVDGPPVAVGHFVLSKHYQLAQWLDDGSKFYYTSTSRGDRDGYFHLVDSTTGSVDTIVSEHTNTFLNLGTTFRYDGFRDYPYSNFITPDGNYVIWQSERSGGARLYRYKISDHSLVNDVTGDQCLVTLIVARDEEWIYFMASGLSCMSDPYYQALCRVRYNGSGFTLLTPKDGEHHVSMGEKYFIDTWSRVDTPPITELYRRDGTFICELERADISGLLELGYQMPQRFKVTASDGETELYGILIRPSDFDESKKYPLIDYVYGGMQCINVPKEFKWCGEGGREIFGGLQAFAQLGFAGMILDGLGTPGRGREIHAVSYKNIHGCAGLRDHVYCASQIAELFPFIDMNRIGIWGNSGGGCAAARGMLEYPDFYKVGVAAAGNHDQRMYDNMWVERYYGLYDAEVYLQGDNTVLAKNLKGHLLIVHGALDCNVSLSQSIRLVDALIRENKDFDFILLPRVDHNVPADPYFIRKRMDYFVMHLLGEEPPHEFDIKEWV